MYVCTYVCVKVFLVLYLCVKVEEYVFERFFCADLPCVLSGT